MNSALNNMRPWSVSFPLQGAYFHAPIIRTQQQKYKKKLKTETKNGENAFFVEERHFLVTQT